jgi:hypothetical protein
MKRFIAFLMILACILSVSITAFAANETPARAQDDILYIDKEPQADTLISDDMPASSDAPVVEDTYKEVPENGVTPRLADGEAGRGSIEAPDKYWAENGYPDDISFAYEAGGEVLPDGTSVSWWEIGIVDAEDSRRQEIINMLSSNCVITFIDCKYSYSQREAAYNEIRTSGDDSIHAAVMSLNTEQMWVEVSEEHLKEYAAKFNRQYGSFIVVTDDLNAAKDDALVGGGINKGNSLWVWTIFAILFMGAASILFFNRTRLIPAMLTTTGTVVTQSAPVSRKETIAAVKHNEIAPSDEVFNSILRKIDKNGG